MKLKKYALVDIDGLGKKVLEHCLAGEWPEKK